MAVEGSAGDLVKVVTLLGAAVVAVPLFKRIGLGSVLGYLAAGWPSARSASAPSPIPRPSSTRPSSAS